MTRTHTLRTWPGILALLALTLTAGAQPDTIKPIVPGVWRRRSKSIGHCNNVVIEMKDYLIVVDANYPMGARMVIDLAKTLSPKPIRWVINTHHHPNHSYGNHLFT